MKRALWWSCLAAMAVAASPGCSKTGTNLDEAEDFDVVIDGPCKDGVAFGSFVVETKRRVVVTLEYKQSIASIFNIQAAFVDADGTILDSGTIGNLPDTISVGDKVRGRIVTQYLDEAVKLEITVPCG